ncbi:hypothetical protein ACFLRN_02945 [Thermoproteota archaeon]
MTEKIFSCTGCGDPMKVYSPDDMHPDAARNKNALMQENIIEISYKCKKCKIINIIYWGFKKIPSGVII